MEGISLDFHCFKALNYNLEARRFVMFIFMPHQIFWWRVGPCNSYFLKLGTVLTFALIKKFSNQVSIKKFSNQVSIKKFSNQVSIKEFSNQVSIKKIFKPSLY